MIPWWWTIICLWAGANIGFFFRNVFEVYAKENEKKERREHE